MAKKSKTFPARYAVTNHAKTMAGFRSHTKTVIKRFVFGSTALLLLVVTIRTLQTSFAASGEPANGLFIQVSSLPGAVSTTTLKNWLEDIRKNHRSSSKPGYINDLVLQDIADQNGTLLTQYLDVLKPYFPGGSTPAFNKVYVGTVDVNWTGNGSKYIEGIENADFRSRNVSLSQTAASAFRARYPTTPIHWYITYEANLAGFWDVNIEKAYQTYFNQLMPVFSKLYGSREIMWSPSFWTTKPNEPAWAIPGLQANLKDLFSHTSRKLVLNLQDFVGQSNGSTTKEDAKDWLTYLKQNVGTNVAALKVNTEQFIQKPDGTIVAGDSAEVPARESYYKSQGFTLGPSWEIRYWHKRIYGN